MREIEPADLRLKLVAADVGIVRIHSRLAKRRHFGERGRGGAGPAIARRQVEDLHNRLLGYSVARLLSGTEQLSNRATQQPFDTLHSKWPLTLNCWKSWLALSAKKR